MAGVQCMIPKGDLPINIEWTLNSVPVISGDDGIILLRVNPRTSSLNIGSLDAEHRGVYKCIATNKAGVAEFSSELHVNGSIIFHYVYYVHFCLIISNPTPSNKFQNMFFN